MTDQQIKEELANALEVQPQDIMDFRKDAGEDTYTVILYNFQKFTRVVPVEDARIPEALRAIYQSPMRGSKAQLLELCDLLEIDPGDKPTKKKLVALINEYKETAQ